MLDENKYIFSKIEICHLVGLSRPVYLKKHIEPLIQAGVIEWPEGKARYFTRKAVEIILAYFKG